MNKVILMGYIGGEPHISVNTENFHVAYLNLATNKSFTIDGEVKTRTDWHTLQFKNKRNLIPHLAKGRKIAIVGELRTDQYVKDDENKKNVYVVVHELEFADSKLKDDGNKEAVNFDDLNFDDIPLY